MKKYRMNIIAAVVLIVFAIFFKFALVGYSFLALAFLSASVVILGFTLLDVLKAKYPRFSKITARTVICGLIIFALVLGITEGFIVSAAVRADGADADCLIVLGAGVNGTVPSLSLVWRLSAARDYLERYPAAYCIVSGGQGRGEDITEAECMRRWLTENGVEAERIIMEDKASSTEENIRFSLEIGEKMGFESYAVVTADYHVYRASLIAEKMGVDAQMVSARTRYPVLAVNYYLREAFALWYYELLEII